MDETATSGTTTGRRSRRIVRTVARSTVRGIGATSPLFPPTLPADDGPMLGRAAGLRRLRDAEPAPQERSPTRRPMLARLPG